MAHRKAIILEGLAALGVGEFRRTMTVITLVWGLGLLADVAISVVLVFRLSIGEYLIVNPVIGYGTVGALSLWSVLYSRQAKRGRQALPSAATKQHLETGAGSSQ